MAVEVVALQGAHVRRHTGIAQIFAIVNITDNLNVILANNLQFTSCSIVQCVWLLTELNDELVNLVTINERKQLS